MDDGLNKIQENRASIGRQLDLLGSEINNLDESLQAMREKLEPLLPLPSPIADGGDNVKQQQESPLMDVVNNLTSRIRSMNSNVRCTLEEIQV